VRKKKKKKFWPIITEIGVSEDDEQFYSYVNFGVSYPTKTQELRGIVDIRRVRCNTASIAPNGLGLFHQSLGLRIRMSCTMEHKL